MRSFEDRMRLYAELIGIFDRIRISWISGRRFAIGKILSFLAIIYPAYQRVIFIIETSFIRVKHPKPTSMAASKVPTLTQKKVFLSRKRYFEDEKRLN